VVIELRSNWVTTVLAGFQTLRMLIKARSGLINVEFTGSRVVCGFRCNDLLNEAANAAEKAKNSV